MVLNTLALPLRLYALSLYGKTGFQALVVHVEGFWRAYRSWYRVALRENPEWPSGKENGACFYFACLGFLQRATMGYALTPVPRATGFCSTR